MSKKFVYDGKEVVLTGRVAKKTLKSNREQILYEIKPEDVTGKQYNRWVQMKDLFEILEDKNESIDSSS